ncbi:hypothetical protein [Campylobacter devanensis]|uniref:hypothetical protein n=1 Tax=Campylobacter devanensis TaxID=3161138 RepID=UPI000A34CC25|nr:hypothetical protein [Campylobacter sp. P0107]
MDKLIIKYIGIFFLFLILVLGCMGFVIYDKLIIEYEKYIKEVIMWIDNSEIKDRGSNYAQWDIVGNEIEKVKRLSNPTEMVSEIFTNGATSDDLMQREIDMYKLKEFEDVATRQLDRMADLQNIVFDDKDFNSKIDKLFTTDKYAKDIKFTVEDFNDISPDIGYALIKNMSDSEFSVYMRKEYGKATEDDIRAATEVYRDVHKLNVEAINSKFNDISLKNYDAIMKAYEDHKEYFGKDSEKFKKLKNPKDIFDSIKGSKGKERMYVSALLATLPTKDLIGMLKDQGTEGFNAFMTLLESKPNNINSFNSAITEASKVLGNIGSNVGPSLTKAVELYNRMGLENLISTNPNIANLSKNNRVYRNVVDKDGNIIGREDTGLLINNYNPSAYIELAKLIKGLQDKRVSYNKTQNIENRIDW